MNLSLLFRSADPTDSIWQLKSGEELVLLLVAIMLLIGMILIGFLLVYLLLILRSALLPEPSIETTQPLDTRSFWQRFAGLHALDQEQNLTMEHAYDGIAELDNPTPAWFMGLFYSTIAFGVGYLLVFHVFHGGNLQIAEYTQEVAIAEVQRAAYIKKVAGSINENTVALTTDATSLESGKALFLQSCVACHGQQGQGGVGPNLTDEYWLHGGSLKAVFHTINEGVPEKGMMSWKKQYNPLQVQHIASFILSLKGTKPAGSKEPQGTKQENEIASR